jgi:uncharacterized membrane protein YcaP (DUF421 family)
VPEWLQIIINSIVLIIFLIFLTRGLGRKIAARMTYFDVVFAMVLGVIAAAVSVNIVKSATMGFIALLTWGLMGIGLSFLSLKSKMVRDFIHGREAVVMKDGKIMEDQLMKLRYTPEDLVQQLRNKQIFNLADVEFAVMESNGEINALLKSDRQPITPKHLGVEVSPDTGVQTVILDGTIMDEPLTTMGLNRGWLHTELDKIGISADNVFIAQVDTMGDLYIDLFDDVIQLPQPSARQLLLATLEKAKADCDSFSLDTNDVKAKEMYKQCASELEMIIYDVQPMLK